MQKIKNYYHLIQALVAAIIFSFPSEKIKVIGVTGTDGKTTTVHMIYEILKEAGNKVSMISTVGAAIGAKAYDTGFHVTTPSSWQIQRYLRKAVDAGHNYFVMETTSHGLDQNRLALVNFEIGVVTNITHDHLDYHGTWENYAQAKAKLFKNTNFAVLNMEDQKSFSFLRGRVNGQIVTYGFSKKSTVSPLNFPMKLKVSGAFNKLNALSAAAATQILGIDKRKIAKALNNFTGVRGRMESISLGQDFKVVVDFAHTPNGLDQALKTLKSENSTKRLIAVFGAAGQRDKLKRPLMGKVASESASIIILTAEDPRNEKVSDICSQIKKGIKNKTLGKNLFIIEDRKEAIEFAINMASKSDTVGIFGKGHEKSMCYGRQETSWDEFETVRNALKRRLNGPKK